MKPALTAEAELDHGSMMSSGVLRQAASRMKEPKFCGMSGSKRARRMACSTLVRGAKAPSVRHAVTERRLSRRDLGLRPTEP